ncbi:FKBP-type peptidyl-prolyl cis-trans isomerase [Mangrovibacterium diazotrophicum]|uniref:Peptidyl-prolyl cis-trans isomerase n=1 Tax=Mangrovibacterium diazotrophicum TaxID=1261403 RepID=A0A419W3T0_9BACT|nr:FKBP-type peptidyl-prolyl cis-trans isomerase [Mangrovibacterium diazotrophicum]RKD90128.1 FKBP-type peptidyl-prolyl cis-trans isomerase SlyD [Mangrovibacterium diazotrophicum]
MAISKNKMVSLTYDLRIGGAEGELIEQATAERPLSFVYGAGTMLPKFEALLEGMEQGKTFEIDLNCADAYGEIDENAIVDLPKSIFIMDGKFDDDIIKIGNTVPMMSTSGQRMNGLVLEITEEAVKMDFNHPLAGEDLHFTGDILEVREATDEEIAATIHGGCGSGCGCGSDSSCGSGGCGCDDESCSTESASGGCGCGC